jgi:hypothetical protein
LDQLKPEVKEKALAEKAKSDAYDSSTSGAIKNPSSQQDFWTLVAICSKEDKGAENWCDIAQSIYNRVGSKQYSCTTITEAVTSRWQYEPTWTFPRFSGESGRVNSEWKKIKDINSAAVATGWSVDHLKEVAKALKDKNLQKSSKTFIGGRTDFLGVGQAAAAMTKNRSKVQRSKVTNQFGYSWGYLGKVVYSPPAIVDSINIA